MDVATGRVSAAFALPAGLEDIAFVPDGPP
jgi:hypothetical protein